MRRRTLLLICTMYLFFSAREFFGQVPQMIPRNSSPTIDQGIKAAAIDSISKALNEVYVFPDVARKMEDLIRKNLKKGNYKDIADLNLFCEKLTEDLRSVSHDKHLSIQPQPPQPADAPAKSPEDQKLERLKRLRNDNFGFRKVELLSGNIGYIDFRYFTDAALGGATAIAAMNFLANADAIIFDLRQNGGGNPSMIQLISSYLFDESVHLNSFYIRRTDEMKQFWTQEFVNGPKMTKVPVYVLTSHFTFSGAEEFTYNLKTMKRGTIIGETTGGGAHPVEFRTFKNLSVSMSLPYGRAINPITRTNWEGTGIEPDIKAPANQALLVARIQAIRTLLEKETDEQKKQALAWNLGALEIEKNPISLSDDVLQSYVGNYGPRKITLENRTLYYQRDDRPRYKLIPLGDDTFIVESLDAFRLVFRRDASGQVNEIVGWYLEGVRDSHKRIHE